MTVYDFLHLLLEDDSTIAVYDFSTETEIFCGEAADAIFEDFSDCEVLSFDLDPHDKRGAVLCLNIETEEE